MNTSTSSVFPSNQTTYGTSTIAPGNLTLSTLPLTTATRAETTDSNFTSTYDTTTDGSASTTSGLYTTTAVNNSNASSNDSRCLWVLYEDVANSSVRIWDVILFVPNCLFLIFVLYRLRRVWHRILSGIGSGGSPIFVTYFSLVAIAAVLSVIRGIVSMTVDIATSSTGSDANKILWVILRFFLLIAELSVLVFGIAFGHLDSRTSIKRVLFVTTFLALIYSLVQGSLELFRPDEKFKGNADFAVYGHGGSLFGFITSLIFLLLYALMALLPFIYCLRAYLSVPTRKSFYVYVGFMALLNFLAALGFGLLLFGNWFGLCLLDGFSLAYFTLFAPLMYWTFLSSYFSTTQPNNTLFSYATQVDDVQNDMSDFDVPGNGITVDSTLSGILVFNDRDSQAYQVPNGHVEEPLHDFTSSSLELASPGMDSTHSFFHSDA